MITETAHHNSFSALQLELDWWRGEHRRLIVEVERLTEENDALRKSAETWIRMYEYQIEHPRRASNGR